MPITTHRQGKLWDAVKQGRIDEVRKLVKKIDIRYTNDKSQNLLHIAAINNYPEILKILLKQKETFKEDLLNAKDGLGLTPLHYAIENEHREIASILLNKKRSKGKTLTNLRGSTIVGKTTCLDVTPLHLCAVKNDIAIAEMIISYDDGETINEVDGYDFTPLHLAAYEENLLVLKFLLDHAKTENQETVSSYYDDDENKIGYANALHVATVRGNDKAVKLLVEYLPINEASTDQYRTSSDDEDDSPDFPVDATALHFASYYGYHHIVEILINKELCKEKAAINMLDGKGLTPLHFAALHGHFKVAKLLLAAGADFNLEDDFGKTALYYAVTNNHPEIVEALLQASTQSMGNINNNNEMRNLLLLEHNFNLVNNKYDDLKTLLHIACERSYTKVATLLILYRHTSLNMVDIDSKTPLHYAIDNHNQEIIRAFRQVAEQSPDRIKVNKKIQNSKLIKKGYRGIEFLEDINDSNVPADILFDSDLKTLINELVYSSSEDENPEEGNAPLHSAVTRTKPQVLQELLSFPNIDIELINNDKERAIEIAHEELSKEEDSSLRTLKSDIQQSIRDSRKKKHLKEILDNYSSADLKMLVEEKVGEVYLLEALINFDLITSTKKKGKKQNNPVTFSILKEIVRSIIQERDEKAKMVDKLSTNSIKRYLTLKAVFKKQNLESISPEEMQLLVLFKNINIPLINNDKERAIEAAHEKLSKEEDSNLLALKDKIQQIIRDSRKKKQLKEILDYYSSADLKMLVEEKVGSVYLLEALVDFDLINSIKKKGEKGKKKNNPVTFSIVKEIAKGIIQEREKKARIKDRLTTDNIRRYLALKAGYKKQNLESTSGGDDSMGSEEELSASEDSSKSISNSANEQKGNIKISMDVPEKRKYIPIFRGINFLMDKFDKDERNEYIRTIEERHTFYSATAYQLAGYRVGDPQADIQKLEAACQVIQEVIATLDTSEDISVTQWWNAKQKEPWQFSNFRFAVQQYYTVNKDGFDQNLLSKIPENQSSMKERLLMKHPRMEEIFDNNPFVSGSTLARHAARYAFGESRAPSKIDLSLDPRYEHKTGKPKHPVVGIIFTALYTSEEYYTANGINVPLKHAQGEMHISHELLQETEVTFPAVMRNVLIQQRVTYPSFEHEFDPDYAAKYGFNEEILTKIKTANRLKWLKKSYTPEELYNKFRNAIKSTHRNELQRRLIMQELREFLITVYDEKLLEQAKRKAEELGGELAFELPDGSLSHKIYMPYEIKEMAIQEAKKAEIIPESSEEDDKDTAAKISKPMTLDKEELDKKRKLTNDATTILKVSKKKKTVPAESTPTFKQLSKSAKSPLFFNGDNSKSPSSFQVNSLTSCTDLNVPKDVKRYSEEDDRWYDQDKVNHLLAHYLANYSEEIELLDAISGTQLGGETLSINLWDRVMQHVIQKTEGKASKPLTLIPLNLRMNHWTLLCIHQNPNNLAAPTVIYIDPFGDYPPETVQTAILENYTEANFDISNIQFQIDSYNCGPWIVAIAEYYAQHHTIPSEDWDFDIEARREKDESLLQLNAFTL